MSPLTSDKPNPLFRSDEPVFIVGGGPSLAEFDWTRLEGRQTVAVNRSYRNLPEATAIYFTDRRFLIWDREPLNAHPAPLFTAKWPKATFSDWIEGEITFVFLMRGREGFQIKAPWISHGNNSGYAAINAAYHLGAREVVLLGFDMARGPGGETHWHEGYIKPNRDHSWQKMLPAFDTILAPAKAAGMSIWNATEGGRLQAIPRRRLSEFEA